MKFLPFVLKLFLIYISTTQLIQFTGKNKKQVSESLEISICHSTMQNQNQQSGSPATNNSIRGMANRREYADLSASMHRMKCYSSPSAFAHGLGFRVSKFFVGVPVLRGHQQAHSPPVFISTGSSHSFTFLHRDALRTAISDASQQALVITRKSHIQLLEG